MLRGNWAILKLSFAHIVTRTLACARMCSHAPPGLALPFPLPFGLLVCDTLLLRFGHIVHLSVRCVRARRLGFIILLWEQRHMRRKMLSRGMQWMEIESFSYFAYHKHTSQIPLIWIGICSSALFIHPDKQTIKDFYTLGLNARVVFWERKVSLPARYFWYLLNKKFTLINASLFWPMTSPNRPELVSEGLHLPLLQIDRVTFEAWIKAVVNHLRNILYVVHYTWSASKWLTC